MPKIGSTAGAPAVEAEGTTEAIGEGTGEEFVVVAPTESLGALRPGGDCAALTCFVFLGDKAFAGFVVVLLWGLADSAAGS
mmetsp:Transcript_15530/g.29492  ORF Transcript_15530/g.29492 Transcript_15530/m.29492 type:complete len:81 (+) Transcript_15530:888-1130(+)